MNLAETVLRKKTVSVTLTLALLLGGIVAFLEMPRLEDPEFTIKQALIVTAYPGATPAEVADEVTDVIEGAAQQLGQLKKVTSLNNWGHSIVTVEIQDKYDKHSLPQVWDELRRKVNDVQGQLPPGAGPSQVIDDFGDVYGILLSVTGDGYSRQDIQDYADFLRKQLLLVNNVAKVTVWGKWTENVYVETPRARMSRIGPSMESMFDTLGQRNLVTPSGSVRVGREHVGISPTGSVVSVEALGDLLIKDATNNNLVPLRDLAEIRRGFTNPPARIMRFNGRPAVGLGISMVPTGNIIDLGEAIRAKLESLASQTPVGMEVTPIYYQPTRVDEAVSSFALNLGEAIVIVIVVLLLFMGLQSGLLIGMILLITICGSFIFIQLAGVALERISLGALIIALGMLVDNAIVIVEGLLIRYQQGMNRMAAAMEVVDRNKWPLLGATIIAIMAFAGIGLSQDKVGEYCRSLFVVLSISLMMSWLTAVTITPLACDMFLRPTVNADGDPYAGRIYQIYREMLDYCMRHAKGVLMMLGVLLAASIFAFGFVQQSFFPSSTQPRFFIHYWLPQGTDIRATSEELGGIESEIMRDERIKSVTTFVGEGGPRFILTYSPEKPNTAYGLLLVEVNDPAQIDAIIKDCKDKLAAEYPDAEPKLKKFRLGPGRDASIEVRFSGPDSATLRRLSIQAQAIMEATGNAESIRDDWRQEIKVFKPVLSEAQAKIAGITRPALANTLQMYFSGSQVGVYREGDKLLPIVVRPPRRERSALEEIGNVQIYSPTAKRMLPIEEVVSGYKTEMEFGQLRTQNRLLTVTASCEPREGLPSALVARLRPKMEEIQLPPGYAMEWGGEHEDASDAQTGLAHAVVLPAVIMVLITIMLFNNLRNPLIIWLTVPLAVIGVTTGLLATGEPFGFMALLGFLSLSGMLIKNAVVLLDQIKLELDSGKPPYGAILDAAVSRIRPVFMAAATTILGMIPLVLDAFFSAMSVTVMSGLAFATVLTLFVVPMLYVLLYGIRPK